MDSVISTIIKQETRPDKTREFIQKAKQSVGSQQNLKKSDEGKKVKKEVDAAGTGKNKNHDDVKNQKK